MPLRWVPLDEAREAVLTGELHNPGAVVGILAACAARDAGWTTLRPAEPPEHPVPATDGVRACETCSCRRLPAFDAFYAEHYRAVVGLAYALSGSRLAAEDIAQEAFVAAYRWQGRGVDPGWGGATSRISPC